MPEAPIPIGVEVERLDAHPGDVSDRDLRAEVLAGLTLSDLVTTVLQPFLQRAPRATWRCRAELDGGWRDVAEVVAGGPPGQHGVRLLVADAPLRALLADGRTSVRIACRPA